MVSEAETSATMAYEVFVILARFQYRRVHYCSQIKKGGERGFGDLGVTFAKLIVRSIKNGTAFKSYHTRLSLLQ